ncbi:Hypothetical protein GLP15_90 [Giardia lamblia P15]|uniref:Uncharacterized protein n=1 Tax=Giardia intestinalis (strain P15) TaxID=658858 RepID=E1F8G9_GIAIA|nr:Hypothetical protein GLP15_90 [Giardia lamblia P15]
MQRRTIFLDDSRAMKDCSSHVKLSSFPLNDIDYNEKERLDRVLGYFLTQGFKEHNLNTMANNLESQLLALYSCTESDTITELVRDVRLVKLIDVLAQCLQLPTSTQIACLIFSIFDRFADAGAEMTELSVRAGLPYLSNITSMITENTELLRRILSFYTHSASYELHGRQQLLLYASADELLRPISLLLRLDSCGEGCEDIMFCDASNYFSLLSIVPASILQPLGSFLGAFLANCNYDFDGEVFIYLRQMLFFFFAITPLFSRSDEWRKIGNDLLLGLNKFCMHQDFGTLLGTFHAWKLCIQLIKVYRDMTKQLLYFIANIASTSVNNNIFDDIATLEFSDILSSILATGIHNAYADVALTIEVLFSQWPPYRKTFRESSLIRVLVDNLYSVTHIVVNSSINIISITIAEAWEEFFVAGLLVALTHYLQNALIKRTVSCTTKFTGRCFRILHQMMELSRGTTLEEPVVSTLSTDALYECYLSAHDFPNMAVYASVSTLLELVRMRHESI